MRFRITFFGIALLLLCCTMHETVRGQTPVWHPIDAQLTAGVEFLHAIVRGDRRGNPQLNGLNFRAEWQVHENWGLLADVPLLHYSSEEWRIPVPQMPHRVPAESNLGFGNILIGAVYRPVSNWNFQLQLRLPTVEDEVAEQRQVLRERSAYVHRSLHEIYLDPFNISTVLADVSGAGLVAGYESDWSEDMAWGFRARVMALHFSPENQESTSDLLFEFAPLLRLRDGILVFNFEPQARFVATAEGLTFGQRWLVAANSAVQFNLGSVIPGLSLMLPVTDNLNGNHAVVGFNVQYVY